MKIKLLFVPTLIISAVFVSIHYIKPSFDQYMIERSVRDTARYEAENIQMVTANIQTLKGNLDQAQDSRDFILRYLPVTKDQARAIDNLNYLVSQSGMLTTNISFPQVDEEQSEAQQPVFATPVTSPPTAGDTGLFGGPLTPLEPTYERPKTKSFLVQVETIGSYENIKDLLIKLQGLDRMQKPASLSIAKNETSEENAGTSNLLKLSYTVDLGYLPETQAAVNTQHVVSVPVFKGTELPLDKVQYVLDKITNPVGDIRLGTDGKVNPFE